MSRQELEDALGGILLDAITEQRRGDDAFRWLKMAAAKQKRLLAEYEQTLKPPPPVNGKAVQPKPEVKQS